MIQLAHATAPFDEVRKLWSKYWLDLGFDFAAGGFDQELASLPGKYAPPRGCLLLARDDDRLVGAVAYRPYSQDACEAKRLYVIPEYRGRGLGRALLAQLTDEARSAGYRSMVADTLPQMTAQLAMYERMGFRQRETFAGATEGAICIEYLL